MGAVLIGLGPSLPPLPQHLGLDGFHKHYYSTVWAQSQMPGDSHAFEPDMGEASAETAARAPSSQLGPMQTWLWNLNTRFRGLKLKVLRWNQKRKQGQEN